MTQVGRNVLNTARFPGEVPRVSFTNLVAGSTTAAFDLAMGLYEMELNAADGNNPGVCTIYDVNSHVLASVNTSIGDVVGATGEAWFVVGFGGLKGCTINVTQAARNVLVFAKETSP